MIKRVLSLWLLFLCLIYSELCSAQSYRGVIGVIREDLPSAKIEVTGKGYPPKRNISETQRRLLAKRAATVDAYRVMSAVLNGISGYVVNGEGIIQTTGFIKGAELSGVKYFANGKVELDLVLPITLRKGVGKKIDWDSIVSDISKRGYPVYYTEKQTRQITEEEWLEMQGKR